MGDHAPPRVQGAGAGQGDHLLGERLHLQRLGQGRLDLSVLEEALHQVPPHGDPVLRVAAQLPPEHHVTGHFELREQLSVASCQFLAAFTSN